RAARADTGVRGARQRRRPGDGRRPRPTRAPRGRICIGACRCEPRGHDRPADRRAAAHRRQLAAPLSWHAGALGDRVRDRASLHPAQRSLRTGRAARARVAARDPARLAVSALHALIGVRDDDVHRDRHAAADLRDHDAPSRAGRMGVPDDPEPVVRDRVPAPAHTLDGACAGRPEARARDAMMGVPFLLLDWDGSAGVIAVVIMIFVTGEMLWVPTSQAVVAALAPADIRGAYMGAFGGTWSVGWALTPFLGLQVRHAYGDATMWMCVASVGVVAGVLGAAAARGRRTGAAIPSLR